MKAFFIALGISLACAGSTSAQDLLYQSNLPPDYYWEVGINAGYSVPTRPLGPSETYQGSRTTTVGDYSVRLNYYPNAHWMLNADFGDRKWESSATWAGRG
jgi:hypothetical protein